MHVIASENVQLGNRVIDGSQPFGYTSFMTPEFTGGHSYVWECIVKRMLRSIKIKRQITNGELAERSGVSDNRIKKYLDQTSDRYPNEVDGLALLKGLRIDPDHFFQLLKELKKDVDFSQVFAEVDDLGSFTHRQMNFMLMRVTFFIQSRKMEYSGGAMRFTPPTACPTCRRAIDYTDLTSDQAIAALREKLR